MAKAKLAKSKPGIALPPQLLERLKVVALEMKMSLNELVALAVEEFLERHQKRLLIEGLSEVGVDNRSA